MFHYMVIFCFLLLTVGNVRAQCNRPVLLENRVLADDTDKQTYPDGSTVRLKCSTGYVPASGSRSITCTGTEWSEPELQCKKKSCGNPGEVSNGKYQYQPEDGVVFGATIKAICNEGFQLVGLGTRNCRETGWDGRAPVCEVVKCLPPPRITGGTFEPDDETYNYHDAVTYSCDRGLDLVGSSELSCSGDGNFQPAPPQCIDVSCERPEIPNAIRIDGKSPPYKLNNFVRYKCEKGYKMEGSDYLVCTENGWNPPPPLCNVITCLEPANITHGQFNPRKVSYNLGDSVTYECEKGFKRQGFSKRSCTDDGTFETPLPECQQIICDSPFVQNAVIDESLPSYPYGISITIKCNKGHRLVGSDYLTCGENGWTPALPRCAPLTCDAPKIANADIVGKAPYQYGNSILVNCHKGYTIEGSGSLVCDENGWNPHPPKCNIVTCSPPPEINNGQFTSLQKIYEYGQTVTYSCGENFKLHGPATISCKEDGTFQRPPECKKGGDYWIPILVVLFIIAILSIFICIYLYIKKGKSEKATPRSKHEQCSLVNVTSEETSPNNKF